MIRVLALCCVMVLTPGCDKKESEASKTGEASNTGSAEGAAPPASFDVGTLGLTGDAPAGTKARSMGKKVMVQGTGLVASVGMAGRFDAANIEAAEKEAKSNNGSNIKSEKLADGFLLTYENKGGAGSNYWVVSRRTIDGKDYACGTTASNAAQQASASAFCKSLKKK